MSIHIFQYPLDLSGISPTNQVVNEEYAIGSNRGRIFVARGGPFFGNTTTLRDLESGRELVPMADYKLLHYYAEASNRADKPVYAVVQITNPMVSTRIGLSTQYIGGEFSFSYYALVEAIVALENDGRSVNFGDLVGLPAEWTPTPHLHDIHNAYNFKAMIDSNLRIEKAIRDGDTASRALLVETLERKLILMDEYKALTSQRVSEVESMLPANLTAAKQYTDQKLTDYTAALPVTLKPAVLNSSIYVVNQTALNRRFFLLPEMPAPGIPVGGQPTPVPITTVAQTVVLSPTLAPANGDFLELLPGRDRIVINLSSSGVLFRYRLDNGTITTGTNVSVDASTGGVRLVYNATAGLWDVSYTSIRKPTVDYVHRTVRTTDGIIHVQEGDQWILNNIPGRQVNLSSVPPDRAIELDIQVTGNAMTIWPHMVIWKDGEVPTLNSSVTWIKLKTFDGGLSWFGSKVA